jgi:Abortive infection alpha
LTEPDKSLDVFGLKPVSEAVSTVTKASVDGASAFLSRICLPAAEEFGLLLRDKVSRWRAQNAAAIVAKAAAKYSALPQTSEAHAHPRIVGAIIEQGSWCDDQEVQSMWAGLLVTACTDDGRSQENLIFVNLLSQLTTSQAKLLNFSCQNATKEKSPTGLLVAKDLIVSIDKIMDICGTSNIHSIDLELDHLREIGLHAFNSGLSPVLHEPCLLTPSAIGLNLYVRCNGSRGSPLEYFDL